jgi:hypothetical protein
MWVEEFATKQRNSEIINLRVYLSSFHIYLSTFQNRGMYTIYSGRYTILSRVEQKSL